MKKIMMLGLCMAFLTMSSLAFAEDVFVTERGKKYHQETCRTIKKSKVIALDELKAKEKGYAPCRRCFKKKALEAKAGKKESQVNLSKVK